MRPLDRLIRVEGKITELTNRLEAVDAALGQGVRSVLQLIGKMAELDERTKKFMTPEEPVHPSARTYRWVNFYPPGGAQTSSWVSRKIADDRAQPGRVACVLVGFAVGEGLSVACGHCHRTQFRTGLTCVWCAARLPAYTGP